MRIYAINDRRFLAAAKYLSNRIPELKLSKVQQALSRALGYRDFHDFQSEHKLRPPSQLDQEISEFEFRRRWVKIIVGVAENIDVDDGTIQYHLSHTRLTGDRTWTLEDHLAIRAQCWVERGIVGLRGRKYGSFGRIKEKGKTQFGEAGFIVHSGKPSSLLGPSGFWNCADYELSPLKSSLDPFIPFSHYIPYGYKLDGEQKVYFGREYFPLWIVNADGKVERPNPWDELHVGSTGTWFAKITGEHFLSDATRALALDCLTQDGIFGLPVFANATPTILKCGTQSLSATVDAMKSHHELRHSWKPILAKYSSRSRQLNHKGDKSVIVGENDWERLLDECLIDSGTATDPLRYFTFGGAHFLRESTYP